MAGGDIARRSTASVWIVVINRNGELLTMRMRHRSSARARLLAVGAVLALAAVPAAGASAATGSVLYSFTGGADGGGPQTPVLLGSGGVLYGTTDSGGAQNAGAVYELTPNGSGWTESVLFSFNGASTGSIPDGGLVADGSGNLYGTVYQGGAFGHGAVYELSRGTGGAWTEALLYSFAGGTDGGLPTAGVIFDHSGNLYGTTGSGGNDGQGVVYKLAPGAGGAWTETVLHSFVSQSADGEDPGRGLVFDAAGNLYGTTVVGGTSNDGVVYELSPGSGGAWTETLLHTFTGGSDGVNPLCDLVFDGSGNLYGTTTEGGSASVGTVFKLSKSGSSWHEQILYSFSGGASGKEPFAGVIFDSAGSLYGTTTAGVFGQGGVVYKLTPSGGSWTESVSYTFDGAGDGSYAHLVRDSSGSLYGTDASGGPQSAGEVFKVQP